MNKKDNNTIEIKTSDCASCKQKESCELYGLKPRYYLRPR